MSKRSNPAHATPSERGREKKRRKEGTDTNSSKTGLQQQNEGAPQQTATAQQKLSRVGTFLLSCIPKMLTSGGT